MIQPLISEIYKSADGIRQKELKRALSKMAEHDEKKMGILDRFSRELVERILQTPIDQLREAALNNDDGLLSAARSMTALTRTSQGHSSELLVGPSFSGAPARKRRTFPSL